MIMSSVFNILEYYLYKLLIILLSIFVEEKIDLDVSKLIEK